MARPRTDADTLRVLLARQSDDLAAEALHHDGLIPAERLEALGRLAKLVEIRETAATSLRRRWAVPAVALGTLVCASVLLFARVSSTEMEMELRVSEFSFVVPTVQAITDALSVSALGVSGLRLVDLPGADGGPGQPRAASDILLTTGTVGRRSGFVSVSPITLPARTRVSVQTLGAPDRFRMEFRHARPELAISLLGPVRIVVPSAVNEQRDFPFPRPVALEPDSQRVIVDVRIAAPAGGRTTFPSPLPAESLSLARIDEFQASDRTLVREVPTIIAGTLYFESLDGHARELRAGEGLRFAWSGGEIREWRLGDDGVVLRFHGMVRGMSAGSGETRRSLMPTVLEWVRARHGLALLWGTTAYVVGLFVTVLGWWRRPS
jgi:hypothetical protein